MWGTIPPYHRHSQRNAVLGSKGHYLCVRKKHFCLVRKYDGMTRNSPYWAAHASCAVSPAAAKCWSPAIPGCRPEVVPCRISPPKDAVCSRGRYPATQMRNNWVMATRAGWRAEQPKVVCRPALNRTDSRHCVQTGSKPHPASYLPAARSWPAITILPKWSMIGALPLRRTSGISNKLQTSVIL